jgi:hypothetical protein
LDADLLVNYIIVGGGGGGGGGVYLIPVAGREAEEDRLCRVSRCQSERNLLYYDRAGGAGGTGGNTAGTAGYDGIRRLLTCRR